VYVDNDPLVLMHARVLLASGPEGATDYIEADFRDPEALLTAAAATLDFTRPVAVMLFGVLGHFGDDDEEASLIERVMAATAPGSYLVIAHGSSSSEGLAEAARQYRAGGAETYHLRGPDQLAGFFAGLELVPPGVVPVLQWRPGSGADPGPARPGPGLLLLRHRARAVAPVGCPPIPADGGQERQWTVQCGGASSEPAGSRARSRAICG
jgi:S-adenosyl methyltransferase